MSGRVLSDLADYKQFVDHLRHELEIVRAERDRLRERVSLLESIFVKKLDENEKSYRDLETQFSKLEKLVFKALRHACRVKKRPVTYEEIIKAFYAKYPFLKGKVKIETITRRVRKLKEDGYISCPKRGYFHPRMEEWKK
ncbi:hypothetical protein J7L13_03665 [bacterium]|nr:hypothetical protein [bacterium]